jgi:hypothetical protein
MLQYSHGVLSLIVLGTFNDHQLKSGLTLPLPNPINTVHTHPYTPPPSNVTVTLPCSYNPQELWFGSISKPGLHPMIALSLPTSFHP